MRGGSPPEASSLTLKVNRKVNTQDFASWCASPVDNFVDNFVDCKKKKEKRTKREKIKNIYIIYLGKLTYPQVEKI